MTAAEVLSLLALAFWIVLAADRRRAWPRELSLPAEAPPAASAAPSVVAVVPARDEAAILPRTLPSLLTQDAVHFRVLLVDDGSSDGTATVAREAARRAGREKILTVVEAPAPPPGWTGKLHALACGVAAAREEPDWYLLTDADIHHRPGAIAALLTRAGEGYDLVSVMARLRTERFWERLLIPAFVFFFQLLYPFRRVRDPRSRAAAAAGGCVLVRPRALAAAGGLRAIRGALIDDVALARAIKGAGGRLWLGFDPGIASLRAYPRLADVWRMVARSAFVQLRRRWDLLAATIAGLLVFFVSPPVLVAWALAAAALAPGSPAAEVIDAPPRAALWSAAAWSLGAAALLPAVRHHRAPRAYALTLPLAALLYALMTLSSAWRDVRGTATSWKGRRYD